MDTADRSYDDLPFLGKLNTVFIVAVAFGMFLIMVAMVLHIINAVRGKNMESAWFDPNGAAGLVFYLAVVVTVVLFMTGKSASGRNRYGDHVRNPAFAHLFQRTPYEDASEAGG